MQFKVGDLVRAHRAMGKGVDGTLAPGDLGLVEELYHKGTREESDPWQLYRIKWLPTTASGIWWMRSGDILPLGDADNAV